MNLCNLITYNASFHPNYSAIICGDNQRDISWIELNRCIRKLANGLSDAGVKKGDVVAICLPNIPECIYAFFAVAQIGGIALMLDTLYKVDEILFAIGNSEAKYLIASSDIITCLYMWGLENQSHKGLKTISVGENPNGKYHFDYLINRASSNPIKPIDCSNEDPVALFYTSLNSPEPRGHMISHGDLMVMGAMSSAALQINHMDRLLTGNPICDVCFVLSVLGPFNAGAGIVTMNRFSPENTLLLMEQYRVTHFVGVPSMIGFILQRFDRERYDLRSLRFIHCSGAPMPDEYIVEIEETFGVAFNQLYGIDETIPTSCTSPCYYSNLQSTSSCWVKVVDKLGKELPPGQVGEILVKGPGFNRGYKKKLKAAIFRSEWYRTGNQGKYDNDGFLYITSR